MKISIIVPVYNVENFSRLCFDSLLNQTIEDIEIILVNDGSTDSSGIICDEYAEKDSRIRVVHQKNQGLGLSRNAGLKIARGDYIGFVDSDDCISEHMYEILYENAMKYTADVSYCSYIKFSSEKDLKLNQKVEKSSELKIWHGKSEIRQYMLDRLGLPPSKKNDVLYGASVCCGIFSRKVLEKLNARFISERKFISEDMIFNIDVIPYCNTIIHKENPLYFYRYTPNSLTTTYKANRFEKNLELYQEMYLRLRLGGFSYEELLNPLSRYLLTTVRIAIIQEVKFSKMNGKQKAETNIKNICSDEELTKILKNYKYWKLPWKYALYCYLIKHKKIRSLFMLTRSQRRFSQRK